MKDIRTGKLDDLSFDRRNANKGSEYGNHLLRKSIQELGVGRGIVAAADGTIIGGNHVVETLSDLGIENVVFVPSDGKTLVVTQRMDIQPDSREFHQLALADNKVGQINLHFDEEVVKQLATDFDFDAHDWGFNIDDVVTDEEEEAEKTPKVDDKVSFQLSSFQLAELTKALATAKLEKALPDGKDSDGQALMVIVKEYLSHRS
ncbi:hypothetical protein BN8_03646 [Fibrisoma limi BUZ 3]|uniref:Uncharacterized protein n=1 Tax=Fibrisoma limi BUZ 3 TaxID=1185876 RepID=I2GKP6_9BACT|nr:hypothetical protein [Fibrisoma limi]CCH54472.1 hypothetical protein BN8_03646 [Fibrisoma limi BUZ 3]